MLSHWLSISRHSNGNYIRKWGHIHLSCRRGLNVTFAYSIWSEAPIERWHGASFASMMRFHNVFFVWFLMMNLKSPASLIKIPRKVSHYAQSLVAFNQIRCQKNREKLFMAVHQSSLVWNYMANKISAKCTGKCIKRETLLFSSFSTVFLFFLHFFFHFHFPNEKS